MDLLYVSGLEALVINYSPKEVCALKGSTVVLKCSYTLPAGDRLKVGFWYRNDLNIPIQSNDARGNRFVYNSQVCLLRITNLTIQDLGLYEYRITTVKSQTALRGPDRVTVHVAGNLVFCVCLWGMKMCDNLFLIAQLTVYAIQFRLYI